ncbi:cyanophycinase [Streptomyces sp. NBC_00335]|uniref:cyanophycinase n=1 Tax=unclassified Streptomyces TaxID=2593676 RepID=UPI00224E7B87|nr:MULTISPECIES: cyanophycinase [unclassified Streptomyces]MCX5409175.1 cyanophycinase [Streptomyces sp. NBC_00086]
MPVPTGARRTALAGSTALLLGLTLAPAAHAHTAAPAGGRGSLVLIGGGLKADNTQVYGEIIKRAGGAKARIGVLTAASIPASQDPEAGDPENCSNSACNGAYYAGLFKHHGAADAQWIPIDLDHITNADSDEVVRQVNSMTGFFFGGGDQFRYVTTLLHGSAHTDSKVLAAMRAKLAAGAVVSGSSAGAQIAAGADMVTGGDSYEGLRDGSSPGYFEDPARLGYLPEGGFGFLRSGLIDTHTGTNGREGRALRLAADTGHDRVYALEENTALVVDDPSTPRERLRVLGPQGVAILDLRQARTHKNPQAGWALTGARYTYLSNGDRYDPHRWHIQPASGKRPLIPLTASPIPANSDVFYSPANPAGVPYSFLNTARALATTTQRTTTAGTFESGPRFTVTFTKQPGFTAWTSDGATAHTVTGLRIAVAPE